MNIEIRNRFNNKIILCGEYESIKDCLQKNYRSNLSGSDLSGSNLSGSNLRGSDLRGSDLSWSNLSESNLSGSNLRGSDLRGSNLRGSDLRGSNLSGSNLRGSDLSGSDLRGSDLRGSDLSRSDLSGVKNYSHSHDIFMQVIKNNSNKFTKRQQEIVSRIFSFRLCWDAIKKEYKKEIGKIFTILADLKFGEFLEEWNKQKEEK